MESPINLTDGDQPVITEEFYQDDFLKESRLLNLLPIAVYICDAQGVIKQYNDRAAQLWGRRPNITTEMERFGGAFRLYTTEGNPILAEQHPVARSLLNGEPLRDLELVVERPDLSRVIVKMNCIPVKNGEGQVTGIVNSFLDITASKQELQRSEDRYYRMIDEVEDYAIFMLNKQGVIQNWNKGAEKIKGYTEDEIVGKHFSIFYTPEDRDKNIPGKLLQEAERNGKSLSEGWRVRKNGTHIWASIVITALHDAGNNVIGFSKVTRDLTERKLAEDRIRQNNIDLEFQNKELEQFAYAAAHDLKEPLRKIQFYSNFIADSIGNELPEKPKDYLVRTIKAASRMQGLIDDLLTYSKTSSNTQLFEEVNLNSVMDEVLVLHHTTIEKTNAVIRKSSLPLIQGIRFQCVQLFDNLVGNALKYRHPHRAPSISISAEKITGGALKEHHLLHKKEFYKISIADNGIGFEPDHADAIFNLFERLHSTAAYTGSGIGLAICKRIVQNHKGFIKATGAVDEGAVFSVFVPAN